MLRHSIFFICLTAFASSLDGDDLFDDFFDGGVTTSSGRVKGLETAFYGQRAKAYLGIPYAAPPTGPLRFKKPQPFEALNETLLAYTMPPACPQYSPVNYPWYDSQEGKSEDCLFLNIWSPYITQPEKYKLPVIFSVYGGGFTVGSNRLDSLNGLGLAVIGPNIVVTPNYRLNALGFLSSGTEDAPGNVGLYDLIHALKWVRENIAAFGGDPDRITLMGQGSGAIAVSYFLMSPLTKGMFDKAILQSGSFVSITQNPKDYNTKLAQKLAEAVDCATENRTFENNPQAAVDCLRDVDAQELARALSSFDPTTTASFLPIWGDDLLPKNPVDTLKQGDYVQVPILVGTNKDEGSFILTSQNPERFGVFGDMNPVVDKEEGEFLIKRLLAPYQDKEAAVHQYLNGVDDEADYEIRKQVYTAAGDFYITCPLVYFAETYNRGNSSAEYYVFGQRPQESVWESWMGVVHRDEVPFIFGRPIVGYNFETFMENYNPELGISYTMIRIWSNFVKDGQALDVWKNFSRHHHQYLFLEYHAKKKMRGPGPHLDNCDFFRDHYGF